MKFMVNSVTYENAETTAVANKPKNIQRKVFE